MKTSHGSHLDTSDRSSDGASPHSSRKVAFASLIGTTIEWYDFFIFGTAAALIFNQVFFPSFDPVTGTLAAFASFSVGFIAGPSAAPSSPTTATRSAASRCWSTRCCSWARRRC